MRTLTVVLLLSISASLGASVTAQSLAEVAKNEEDRRKGAKPAPKVYTNGDLKAVPAPPAPTGNDPVLGTVSSASSPAADAGQPATDATTKPSAEVKDRAYWNKRILAARAQLDHDKVLAEALQSRVNALTNDFANRDDPAQRARLATDRDKALAELNRLKASVAADQQAIPAIEEEARRAGVPPGWLR